MKRKNDEMIGAKINRWKVIDYVIGKKGIEWICECECGRIKRQKVWNIKSGRSKMCKECSEGERRKEREEGIKGEERKKNG